MSHSFITQRLFVDKEKGVPVFFLFLYFLLGDCAPFCCTHVAYKQALWEYITCVIWDEKKLRNVLVYFLKKCNLNVCPKKNTQ